MGKRNARSDPQSSANSEPPETTTDSNTEVLRREIQSLSTKIDSVLSNQRTILERIDSIESKQAEMEQSLQFYSDSITNLEKKVADHTTELGAVSTILMKDKTSIEALKLQINKMERYSRSFNLRFGGVEENPNEDAVQIVKNLITKELNMHPEIAIENAHRIGKPRANETPRHIIAKFLYRPQRFQVYLKAKSMLKASSIFVTEDLTEADLDKKRGLRDVMDKAYKEGKKHMFRNGNLYINGRLYK